MSEQLRHASAMVRPLRQCVLRCDPYLRLVIGGTYGYTRGGGSQFHGGVDLYARSEGRTRLLGRREDFTRGADRTHYRGTSPAEKLAR